MEQFLSSNQMYIVLIIVLLVWAGLAFYLVRIDRKLQALENQMKKG